MFDPGGVGEWSPPQSPFGGLRGKKRKSGPLLGFIYSVIIPKLKAQATPATGSRACAFHIYSIFQSNLRLRNRFPEFRVQDQALSEPSSGGSCPGADSYSQHLMLCSGREDFSDGEFTSQIFSPYSTRASQRGA